MKAPTLQTTGPVPVTEIDDRNRLRPVSQAGVEALKASIAETGVMKDAIHVRRKKGHGLVLIAGAHRLEAARQLGWSEIEAKVWTDVTDDWARLMEIDDNLAGAEMGPLDTAVFLAERKRVYERLHPETRHGGDRRSVEFRNQVDMMSVRSFVATTAEKFGLSDRHVRRLVWAGEKLGVDSARLRSAPRPVTLNDLMQIAKIGEPALRYAVVDALIEGKAKSAAGARRTITARERGDEAVLKDRAEADFIALTKAWTRASTAAKKRFLINYREQIWEASNKGEPLWRNYDGDGGEA
ncbi:ParB/RepB/Spo0J family partition protein [Tabrizicola flagellatus]|uniref:ParB/RepB/Spo0J family partition protein n=1 Tax=Tabrizicola flagellatus TaxID=2593021 RepID=UPI0011F32F2F|nr:ParB N-terminal domain-containing protein [Tabrizicola flagellatus]